MAHFKTIRCLTCHYICFILFQTDKSKTMILLRTKVIPVKVTGINPFSFSWAILESYRWQENVNAFDSGEHNFKA